jgi:hypothetical protein
MSDEISAAISESISDLSGSDADTSVDTTTDLAPSGESAAVGDPAGDPAVDGDAPPPETDPTTGDPVQRQMSRSQKRIMQLVEQQKAAEAKWQADLAERDNRLKEFEWAQDPQARLLNNGMQLMLTDKQRFVNEVLLKDPDYQNLIALKEAQAQAAVNQPEPLPNFPEPDTLFGDGTPGHSPQVISQYVQAVAQHVAREAATSEAAKWSAKIGELESLVKPIAQERYDTATYNAKLAANTEAISDIEATYGPLAKEMKGEMFTWLQGQWKSHKRAGLDDAVKHVLVPALRKQLEEARAELLSSKDNKHALRVAASNNDAAAAERAGAAGAGASSGSGDEITDAILGSIAGLSRN